MFSSSPAEDTTRLPTSSSAKKIHMNDTGAALPWQIPLFGQKGNKKNTTNLRVHYVLHEGMWYHDNKGVECNWALTIKSHGNNKNMVELVARLLRNPSCCKNNILAKRHDIAHPLWRIVFLEWDAKSNYGGYFYLGWKQNDDEPQKINGAVNVSTSLLPLVAISVAEAELGGTFYNAKNGKVLRLTLE